MEADSPLSIVKTWHEVTVANGAREETLKTYTISISPKMLVILVKIKSSRKYTQVRQMKKSEIIMLSIKGKESQHGCQLPF